MAPPSQLTTKLKLSLKLSVSRLRMIQQKELALSKQARRHMAQLLETGKLESARIRVENIIRQDILVELLEILELYCELLLARIGLIDGAKDCDPGLEEAVRSIIYAAPRTDVRELGQVRELLMVKYGKEFSVAAMENRGAAVGAGVPERVLGRLRPEPPARALVDSYLREIARTYGVPWPEGEDEDDNDLDQEDGGGGIGQSTTTPPRSSRREKGAPRAYHITDDDDDEDDASDGSDGGRRGATRIPTVSLPEHPAAQDLTTATPPRKITVKSPIHVAPASPTTENLHPVIRFPEPPALRPPPQKAQQSHQPLQQQQHRPHQQQPAQKKGIPEQDDLLARFAALKRR